MDPLLKWAGGKRHIVGEIRKRFPTDWQSGTYFEPFLGGAAVFFDTSPDRAVLSDLNSTLIEFYRSVQNHPERLVGQIQEIVHAFNQTPSDEKNVFFYELRNGFNADRQSDLAAARFYALNKLCFNGLYRENLRGHFNVPFGNKHSFPLPDRSAFLAASAALAAADLRVCDFESSISSAKSGDFIYFDPPYVPVSVTSSFTGYAAGGFGLSDQQRLATVMKGLAERGVRAVLSNSDTAATRSIFSGLKQHVIRAPRMVSASAAGRGTVNELLVLNF